jgi:flavodoxin
MTGTGRADTGKTLVVYYSLSGNTARVAREIAKRMNADVESIQDKHHGVGVFAYLKDVIDAVRGVSAKIDAPLRDPRDYSLVIVGTPVWAGHITPAVRAYLEQTVGQHEAVAFFVTSGNTGAEQVVPAMELAGKCKAIAFTGFNAHDLAARSTYDRKIAEFLHSMDNAHSSHGAAHGEPVHAH